MNTTTTGRRNTPTLDQTRDMHCGLIALRAETINEQARTVTAVVATEGVVQVFDFARGEVIDEILTIAGAQLPDRSPLLANHFRHDLDQVLGSARGFQSERETILAVLEFDDDEISDRAWRKVVRGHLNDVSAGYRIDEAHDIPAGESRLIAGRTYKARGRRLRVATKWTIREVSIVPVGADPAAKIREDSVLVQQSVPGRSMLGNASAVHASKAPTQEQAMSLSAGLCLRAGLEYEQLPYGASLCTDGRRRLQERLATQGEQYSRMSLPDICSQALAIEGRSEPADRKMMVRAALTTSTLQHAFENSVNAHFSRGYETAEDSTRRWCDEGDVTNFKQHVDITLGKTTGLKKLNRGGTARQAVLSDNAEVYRLARYANRLEIDEQDILGDSANLFNEIPGELGDEAAQLRPNMIYSLLFANPSLSSDLTALFHASHGNLSGVALGISGVQQAIVAMAQQTRNGRPLNLVGRHLIVPTDTRYAAKQMTQSLEVRGAGAVNGTKNSLADEDLNVVSDGRLGSDGVTDPTTSIKYTGSETNWVLASEHRTIKAVYLSGTNRRPSLRSYLLDRGRWGMGWDIHLDLAVYARDYRGLFFSTGNS